MGVCKPLGDTLSESAPASKSSRRSVGKRGAHSPLPPPTVLPVWLTDTVTPDLDRALHYTLLWGLQGVELRTVGGVADRVPRVDEQKVKRSLEKDELLPAAVDPGLFETPLSARARWMNGLATFGETVRFCERIGCPRVVVSTFRREDDSSSSDADEALPAEAVRAYRRAADRAARAGITLAVLNEPDARCRTGASLARLLDAVDRPGTVQAAWNPAAALRAGEDPAEGLRALSGERVTLVRCADGTKATAATGPDDAWQPTSFGKGHVAWDEQLRRLSRAGFDGPLSLEIHVEPRPKEGLRAATRLIKMIRAAGKSKVER